MEAASSTARDSRQQKRRLEIVVASLNPARDKDFISNLLTEVETYLDSLVQADRP